ncbi:MAG: ArnT family glycosyltransferase [Candidatus Levyibacteriota bacterium]
MDFIRRNYLIILIVLLSLFLRIYKLNETMQFIPDQGWFYLAARNMLLTGKIPLVGIETSHTWLHHGPLWTYMLGILFAISRFNPVFPAYYMVFLGVLTVGAMYYAASKIFSKRVGLVASLLFAVSPLLVMNSRLPYHTSPIPLFVVILFYLTYLWVKGNPKVFPFIAFLLGVLYNHEITTFVFAIAVGIIFLYGMVKKEEWLKKTVSVKIIFYSLLLFIIPMVPFILYDIGHGYKQTFGFLVWMAYRVVKLPLGFVDKRFSESKTSSSIPEFFSYYKELVFPASSVFSLLILSGSFMSVLYLFLRKRSVPVVLLILFFVISILGLFIHRAPIEADTLLVAPFFIMFLTLLIETLLKSSRFFAVGVSLLVFIVLINSYLLFSTNFFTLPGEFQRISFSDRMKAVDKIIELSQGKKYNIKGKGELSDLPVFLMPYEYLLWWDGHPVSHSPEKTVIQVWEANNTIQISKIK